MISILTKVLPGGALPMQAVQWPSASADYLHHDTHSYVRGIGQADAENLRTEVAKLQSELNRTRTDIEQRAQEAFAAGKREGEAVARRTFEQQWEAEMAKLNQMMQEVAATGPKLRRQAEEDLVRLAVAVARRILHRELTVDVEALAGLIKAALERLDQREIQQIRTDRGSAPVVQKIADGLGTPKPVRVIPDGRLRRGSVIIETQRGQLDASVETQLNEIERGFVDLVRQS